MEPTLGGSITASATSATATATASAPIDIGFEYDSGTATNLSDASLHGSADFNDSDSASLTFSAGVGLKLKLLDVVGVAATFATDLGFNLELAQNPCVTVDLGPRVTFEAVAEAWVIDWSMTIAEWSAPKVTLFQANPSPPCAFGPPDYWHDPAWVGWVYGWQEDASTGEAFPGRPTTYHNLDEGGWTDSSRVNNQMSYFASGSQQQTGWSSDDCATSSSISGSGTGTGNWEIVWPGWATPADIAADLGGEGETVLAHDTNYDLTGTYSYCLGGGTTGQSRSIPLDGTFGLPNSTISGPTRISGNYDIVFNSGFSHAKATVCLTRESGPDSDSDGLPDIVDPGPGGPAYGACPLAVP